MTPASPKEPQRRARRTRVRPTRREDFPALIEICRRVYQHIQPWGEDQLASHLAHFAEGQLVAVTGDPETGGERVVGMAASLIVRWDDYDISHNWRDFTDHGYFTNHDPEGLTLYGAEVMVDPELQRSGAGSALYRARETLVRRLGLKRIRAGARLRGYHRWADRLSAEEYVERVVAGTIRDPTLSFQLNRGFDVLAVVPDYLHHDPASQGHAALIEWLNPDRTTAADAAGRDPRYHRPGAG